MEGEGLELGRLPREWFEVGSGREGRGEESGCKGGGSVVLGEKLRGTGGRGGLLG